MNLLGLKDLCKSLNLLKFQNELQEARPVRGFTVGLGGFAFMLSDGQG